MVLKDNLEESAALVITTKNGEISMMNESAWRQA